MSSLGPGGEQQMLGPGGTKKVFQGTTGVDMGDLMGRVIKYAVEGLAVAIAAFLLPKWMGGRSLPLSQIGMIGMVALATFALLDYASPSIAGGARQGAGFGIGAHLVGFP